MKALEKDRTRRYASASDIAADIQRHLTDQPVLAGPPSLAYTAKKFVHRHRGPVAAGLVVLATLVAGLVGTSLMYVSASRANVRAEQQRAGAEQERAEAVRQNYTANLVAADSSLRMNEVPEAKRRLAACDPKLRNWEWRYLSHEVDSSVAVLRDAGNVPVRAWFVPDGSHILGLTDSTHPPEGRRVDLASGPRNVLVKWEPDGRTSATRRDEVAAGAATADGGRVTDGLRVLETSSGRVVCVLDWEQVPGVRERANTPRFITNRLARPGAESPDLKYAYQAIAFSTDGTLLATGESGMEPGIRMNPPLLGRETQQRSVPIRIWDAKSGQLRATLTGHRGGISALAFSRDQRRLVSGYEDGAARVWDLGGGSTVATLIGHTSGVVAVAFNGDGTRVATGSRDQTARVWNAGTGALIQTMTGHGGSVTSVGFNPDARWVVSGSTDKTMRVWDAESGREIRCLFGHDAGVLSVAFSPDGDRIVSGSEDGSVRIWMLASAGPLDRVVRASASGIIRLSYSQTGTVIATTTWGVEGITTWDASSGKRLAEITTGEMAWWLWSMNRDGSKVVVQSRKDGGMGDLARTPFSVRVFDARSGQQVGVFGDREPPIGPVAYRPDSGRIATVDDDRESITLWDGGGFKPVLRLGRHAKPVTALTYSPDGRMIASGDSEGTVRLWDDASGRVLHVLQDHTGRVQALAFSRDGASLASAAFDGTARMWNTHSGQLTTVLRVHDTQSMESVSFSPDGSRVVTAAGDKTVRVWDAKTGDQLLVLRYRTVHAGLPSPMIAPATTGPADPTLSGSSGSTWMEMSETSWTGLSRYPRTSSHKQDSRRDSSPARVSGCNDTRGEPCSPTRGRSDPPRELRQRTLTRESGIHRRLPPTSARGSAATWRCRGS